MDTVLFTPQDKREEATAVRHKFSSPDGDHLTLLNIYRAYKAVKGNKVYGLFSSRHTLRCTNMYTESNVGSVQSITK